MIYQHMRFTGAAMLSVGDLLAHAVDRRPAFRAARDAARTAPCRRRIDQLGQLIAAMSKDSTARDLLESDGEPQQVLDELRSLDSPAGRAVSGYLDVVGCRLLDGFDIGGRYALELPDALLRSIRAAVEQGGVAPPDVGEQIADIRRQVPEQHRAQFDELVDEARLMYRLRDERGVFSDVLGFRDHAARRHGCGPAAHRQGQDP